jgi:tetratricopeptide (TPR) repeat protein
MQFIQKFPTGRFLRLVVLLFAIGVGFHPWVGNILYNIANANATKTLLGRDDRSLQSAANGYRVASNWFVNPNRTDIMSLAVLRATGSCYSLRSADFDHQDEGLAFQGRCLWLAGEREQAVQIWQQADAGNSLIRLADYDKAQGQSQKALEEYEEALAVAPTSLKGWVALGDLYERSEKWQEAEQAYEQAIRVAPDSALAHQTMAFFRWRRGWADEQTEQELEMAIRLALADPQAASYIDFPWLYTDLALRYIQTGRPALAEEAARSAIALSPRIAYSHHFLGEALRLQGDSRGAIVELNLALELGSTNIWVRYSLAMAYLQAGALASAKQEAQRLATLDPQFEGLPALNTEIQKFEAAH